MDLMSVEIIVVFALVVLALVLFASELLSFDVVALIIMSILMLSGILTTEEGLSGFSNPATITIGAMFVVSEGIRRTGALEIVGDYFSSLGNLDPDAISYCSDGCLSGRRICSSNLASRCFRAMRRFFRCCYCSYSRPKQPCSLLLFSPSPEQSIDNEWRQKAG